MGRLGLPLLLAALQGSAPGVTAERPRHAATARGPRDHMYLDWLHRSSAYPAKTKHVRTEVRVWHAVKRLAREGDGSCQSHYLTKIRGGYSHGFDTEPMWPPPPAAPARASAADALYSAMVHALCTQPGAERAPLVVEVGSFDGRQAAEAAAAGCRVIAMEPSPPNLKKVLAAKREGDFSDEQFKVLPTAAAAEGGTALFRAELTRDHSLAGAGDGLAGDTVERTGPMRFLGSDHIAVRVGTARLDDALGGEPRVDLLKVDVQGAEWEVLRGAAGLLRSGRIGAALVEVSPVLTTAMAGSQRPFNVSAAVAHIGRLAAAGLQPYIVDVASMFFVPLPPPPRCAPALLRYLASSAGLLGESWQSRWGLWADLLFVRPGWPVWTPPGGRRRPAAEPRRRRGQGRAAAAPHPLPL
eukprot:TRINITY_DN2280_c0_g1_i6.p1 TRINITY_DN2280_c0_g1~~TRINITY_DN2280_c0_g1_i6.p1  ORF type:complete len:412 (+),score=84.97 TRINITY_DN2280_c0_g1_i6:68-1303(+)